MAGAHKLARQGAGGHVHLADADARTRLNKNPFAGLALTAHNNSVLNSTLFDNVAVKP